MDEKNEAGMDNGDDEILDLTEVAESAELDDEPVLDLTEAADDISEADEEVLDLTEAAEPVDVETEPDGTDEEDAVLDLSEEVSDQETDEIVDLTEAVSDETPEDEPVIDLDDTDEAVSSEGDAAELMPHAEAAGSDEEGSLVELNEMIDSEGSEPKVIESAESDLEDTIGLAEDDEEDLDASEGADDFMDSLGMEIGVDPESVPAGAEAADDFSGDTITLRADQIEVAVERVIDRMFSEKIEDLIREVIEIAVKREIAKLREMLLDEISED